jgi:hypothetical protein
MRKQVITAATAITLALATTATISFVAGIGGALAAETGTKTMPDSSVNPPPTPRPVLRHRHRHNCALPLSHCNNNHRIQN